MSAAFGRALKNRPLVTALVVTLIVAAAVASRFEAKPRPWKTGEIPVSFWGWKADAPAKAGVEKVRRQFGARQLFLRAGQLEYEDGEVRRVRPVGGTFLGDLDLHLVYNATPTFLKNFENVDAGRAAEGILQSLREDARRAENDGARVTGIQLDVDAPTRLLPHYAQTLKVLRARLPQGIALSVTGLITWTEAPTQLSELLEHTDFWVPQCYGLKTPRSPRQGAAIAIGPDELRAALGRIRRLKKPYWVGLPAYGWAVLYSANGEPVDLFGDLDPSHVASDPRLNLVDRRPCGGDRRRRAASTPAAISSCHFYRANEETIVNGTTVKVGETLVLEMPNVEELRASARIVREWAGEKLLGICVFRLPTDGDPATLTAEQIRVALADAEASASIALRAQTFDRRSAHAGGVLRLSAENDGTVGARPGGEALTLEFSAPAGSLRGVVGMNGFTTYETLCPTGVEGGPPLPCGVRRASIVRLKSPSWQVGATADAVIELVAPAPRRIEVTARMKTEDDREVIARREVTVGQKGER